MKLPISLLVLAALSQAMSVPFTMKSEANTTVAKTTEAEDLTVKDLTVKGSAAKDLAVKGSGAKDLAAKSSGTKDLVANGSEAKELAAKGSGTKQKDNNQTSKRELFEGNFGDRNKEIVSKYELKEPPPQSALAKELHETISEHTPAHQMFGERLLPVPQLTKISDVLSGQGPSFEEAVARQLHSPVSVYQTIVSLPTSFEVPTPAASQSSYSNPKADRLRNAGQDEQKLQEALPKSVKIPKAEELVNPLPLYTVNQPRLRFDSHPQSLDSRLGRQHKNPEEVFGTRELPRQHMSLLFPLYDQLGPFRHPGQVVPSQYSQRQGIFQIFPVARDFDNSYQEGNRGKDYSSEDKLNFKGISPKLQIDRPVHKQVHHHHHKQGYHAHPNGAISFARFTHNVHGNMQHDTAPQPQSESFHQPQPAQYQSQAIPVQLPQQVPPELMLQSQEQNEAPVKLPYPPTLQGLIRDLQKYQPAYQQPPQFNPFNQQIQHQPKMLNALQQHLLLQEPRQSSNHQIVQWQREPSFNALPQSLISPESYLKKSSRSPIASGQPPRPFSFSDHNSLPPLKPNYSKYVKPLEPNTTPIFLPTPLQTLPTSTAKVEPVSDQVISSTTIQPDVKSQEIPKTQSEQEETESQSKITQLLKPEVFQQSQQTVQAPVQSTTYLPFVTNEPQSIFFQYSTPQSTYQSESQPTYQPESRPTPQRHDVVIQQQEIQELFFEPTSFPSDTSRYRKPQALVFSTEKDLPVHQLRTQHPQFQFFEQLLPYQHENQDIHSPQQYIVEARESQQKQVSAQRETPQQYLLRPHLNPLQQFQQQLLQSQQYELEQSHNQQQRLNQEQQQHSHQAYQQQEALDKTQHQQVFVGAHQQQQLLNQAQQKQESEQEFQQQQQALEQAQPQQVQQQKQESEQAQQQIHESEQALQQQYQQNSLEPSNQIQVSTLAPPQDTETQTETVELQQQTESQTELQQDSKHQSSTGKPDEHPEHLSEPTSNVQQPFLGPFLTPSVIPQLYARQQLVAQPDHGPLLGVPSYSDVQYFGKFAETLFGNH